MSTFHLFQILENTVVFAFSLGIELSEEEEKGLWLDIVKDV